jgi:hypothetical protein
MESMTLVQTMAQPSSFGMSAFGHPTTSGFTATGVGFGGYLATAPSIDLTTDVVRERRLSTRVPNEAKHAGADWGSPAWSPSSC